MRLINKLFGSGPTALVAFGFLFAAAGAAYQWIYFPMSAAVSGFHLGYAASTAPVLPAAKPAISQGLVFLLCVLIGTIGEFLGYSRFRRVMGGVALGLLLFLPIYLVCIDGRWIETFMEEGNAFQNQNRVLGTYFVHNSGLDTTFKYMTSFETLLDRLNFVWEAIGSGWYLAAIGAATLIFGHERKAEPGFPTAALLMSALIFLIAIPVFGTGTIQGDMLRIRAEKQLAAGAYASAVSSFAQAIDADPILGRSTPYMVDVSKAYYELRGARSPYGMLYLANTDIQNNQFDIGFALLKIFSTMPLSDQPRLEQEFRQAAAKIARAGRVQRGLTSFAWVNTYGLGDRAVAGFNFWEALNAPVTAYPQPVDVNFMIARIELDLHQYDSCIRRAEHLLDKVALMKSAEANLYSTAADCYAGKHDYVNARIAFTNSNNLDDRENYRAIQGLAGF